MLKQFLSSILLCSLALVASCDKSDGQVLISMSALIGSPEKFDGKEIVVTGFLGRGADVYLTEKHAEIDDRSSSLLLGIEEVERAELIGSLCKGRYVEVSGRFGMVRLPGLTPRIGITNVSGVIDKQSRKECT